jgi:hypothetical protein
MYNTLGYARSLYMCDVFGCARTVLGTDLVTCVASEFVSVHVFVDVCVFVCVCVCVCVCTAQERRCTAHQCCSIPWLTKIHFFEKKMVTL